jgi:cobalamin synthase
MIFNTFKNALLNAWNMLIELPLPFKHDEDDMAETESTILLTQAFFPIVGLICALLAMLLEAVLNKFLYPIPAAAIFAAVLTFCCIFKDRGRGLAGLMSMASLKQDEIPFEERLYELPDNITDVDTPTATLTMILVVLFKLFAFSLMAFYGYVYWLVAICVLEFAIEGDLATLPSFQQGQPLLKIKKSKQRYIWFIAGFLVLFVLFKAPVSSLILFGAAFALSYGLKIYCGERLNGIDGKIIGLAAYIFELFALFLGVVLLTKGQVIP